MKGAPVHNEADGKAGLAERITGAGRGPSTSPGRIDRAAMRDLQLVLTRAGNRSLPAGPHPTWEAA